MTWTMSDYGMEVIHIRHLAPFELCLFVRRWARRCSGFVRLFGTWRTTSPFDFSFIINPNTNKFHYSYKQNYLKQLSNKFIPILNIKANRSKEVPKYLSFFLKLIFMVRKIVYSSHLHLLKNPKNDMGRCFPCMWVYYFFIIFFYLGPTA